MSKWKEMSDEQKKSAIEKEKIARRRRRESRTPEETAKLKEQRKAARERRKGRDLEHHRQVASAYKRNGKGWFYSWAYSLRMRANEKGVPYDIDADYLMSIYTDTCPVFGVKFERRTTRTANNHYSPTVDRINPTLGYEEEIPIGISYDVYEGTDS